MTAKSIFLYLLFMFFLAMANAQSSIEVIPEKTTILLGEPLLVQIKITGNKAMQPTLPDTLGHFEILETKPITVKNENGLTVSTQNLVITSFDSGKLSIPPIAIKENKSITSAHKEILINTIPADSTLKYSDIKQISGIEPPSQMAYTIGLLLALLISVFGLYSVLQKIKIYRKNKEQAGLFENEIIETPSSLLQQIKTLRLQWEAGQMPSALLGNKLMQIFRKYLAGQGINILSKTGEEIIIFTKEKYNTNIWMGIAQTVRLCNAMRFGKYQASITEGIQGIEGFEEPITKKAYGL